MELKEDWEQAKQRMEAWWVGEVLDRPCLQVTAPKPGWQERLRRAAERPADISLERWWTDVELILERERCRLEGTFFGGEAFPLFNPNLGPDIFAAFLGSPLRFVDTTTNWADPAFASWEEAPTFRLDRSNRWWQLMQALLRAASEAGEGRWITGVPDTHAGADALSALRGTDLLCLDFYDRPEQVRQALRQIDSVTKEVYEAYFAILQPQRHGSSSGWLPAWHHGRANAVQCDFIALISPAIMREFVLPSILAELECLDRAVFHLDGPGAIVHLETLLELPQIQAIQWVPGAGNEPMTRWIPLLQRIQDAGKGLHLSCTPEEVPVLLSELRPQGLLLHTSTATVEQAQDLLQLAAKKHRPG